MRIAQLVAAVVGLGVAAAPKAEATYIAYLYQDGSNVVATGSGSLDTTDLSFFGTSRAPVEVNASFGYLGLGQSGATDSIYDNLFGSLTFGAGGVNASTGSGLLIAVEGNTGNPSQEMLALPSNYVSKSSLGTSTDTWDNTTLAALGASVGTYVWAWGSGADVDSFTLHIGEAPFPQPAPEPASIALLAIGLAGLASIPQRQRKAA